MADVRGRVEEIFFLRLLVDTANHDHPSLYGPPEGRGFPCRTLPSVYALKTGFGFKMFWNERRGPCKCEPQIRTGNNSSDFGRKYKSRIAEKKMFTCVTRFRTNSRTTFSFLFFAYDTVGQMV